MFFINQQVIKVIIIIINFESIKKRLTENSNSESEKNDSDFSIFVFIPYLCYKCLEKRTRRNLKVNRY